MDIASATILVTLFILHLRIERRLTNLENSLNGGPPKKHTRFF